MINLISQSSIQTSILSQVGTVASAPAVAPEPRLVKAAHEFEAAMMKELMAPLTSAKDLLGNGDDEGSSSALTSFAQEALGKAISEHGGFGMARSIIHQFSAKGNHSGKPPVPGIRGLNPPIPPFK